MPKLLKPLKELRRHYSQQVNRGRELLARHIERGPDFTQLVADAEAWDRENVQLIQLTYSGETPEYDGLPPLATTEDIDRGVHNLRRDITASLNQLDRVENSLAARKSGCLGLG